MITIFDTTRRKQMVDHHDEIARKEFVKKTEQKLIHELYNEFLGLMEYADEGARGGVNECIQILQRRIIP
jgi:hypothetical protein